MSSQFGTLSGWVPIVQNIAMLQRLQLLLCSLYSSYQCLSASRPSSAHMRGRVIIMVPHRSSTQPNPPDSDEGQKSTTGRERSSRRAAAWGAPAAAAAAAFCSCRGGTAARTVAGTRGGGTTAVAFASSASSSPLCAAAAGAGICTCALGPLCCSSLPDAPAPSSPETKLQRSISVFGSGVVVVFKSWRKSAPPSSALESQKPARRH